MHIITCELSPHMCQNSYHKKPTNNECQGEFGEKEAFPHCSLGCELSQPLWRTVWRFLIKLKIELLYNPTVPILDIYPEKIIIPKEKCTPVFISLLYTITRTQKQFKCLLIEEWKDMWYIHPIEYYSAIKKNEKMSFAATWMNIEIVILSEISQIKTNII